MDETFFPVDLPEEALATPNHSGILLVIDSLLVRDDIPQRGIGAEGQGSGETCPSPAACGCADIFLLEAQHRTPLVERIARKSDRTAVYESDSLPGRYVHVMFYQSDKTDPFLLVSRYA